MFCPKCGSILMPKKEGSKTVSVCSCGYKSSDSEAGKIKEEVKDKSSKVEVVEKNRELDALPSIDAECPKCGHKRAKYWLMQTRAGDEPETKFLKCEKCKHTWRDYN
ncbi:MAG: transcription factor S [Nanoarchaeota archaeon]|nr:transcription factor S [Nanoarchaeota archaeon]